jgi:hypothetical protein
MIENARYSEDNQAIHCTIDGQFMSVPANTSNRHYQIIQAWLAEDSTHQIDEYVPAPPDTTPTVADRLAALEIEVEELKRGRSDAR